MYRVLMCRKWCNDNLFFSPSLSCCLSSLPLPLWCVSWGAKYLHVPFCRSHLLCVHYSLELALQSFCLYRTLVLTTTIELLSLDYCNKYPDRQNKKYQLKIVMQYPPNSRLGICKNSSKNCSHSKLNLKTVRF